MDINGRKLARVDPARQTGKHIGHTGTSTLARRITFINRILQMSKKL